MTVYHITVGLPFPCTQWVYIKSSTLRVVQVYCLWLKEALYVVCYAVLGLSGAIVLVSVTRDALLRVHLSAAGEDGLLCIIHDSQRVV